MNHRQHLFALLLRILGKRPRPPEPNALQLTNHALHQRPLVMFV